MRNDLLAHSAKREKDPAHRTAAVALALCLALLASAIEARAECQYVRGGVTETFISSPNDLTGRRVLGIVTGVLNGAFTAFATSLTPSPEVLKITSYDVFVTNRGDMLSGAGQAEFHFATGKSSGEVKIDGGAGQYAGATGTITLEGQAHPDGTSDVIYRGCVCGPNVKAGTPACP